MKNKKQIITGLERMCSDFYLIAQFLLGVNAAGCGEGVVEQNESVAFHIEGQVRAEDNTIYVQPVKESVKTTKYIKICLYKNCICSVPRSHQGTKNYSRHAVNNMLWKRFPAKERKNPYYMVLSKET